MQAVSGRTRESGKRPRLTSGLQGERCWGRTISIDSEVRTLDHLNDLRHAHPSAIPVLPSFPSCRHSHPSAIPVLPSFPPLRHSCAPSVIPAEAGIHATAQPCDEPPSARRPTRAPSAPRVIGRRRALGAPLTPQIAWIPASAGMTEGACAIWPDPLCCSAASPPPCGGRVVQWLLSPQSPQAAEALRCDVSRGRCANNDIMAARLRRHRPGLGRPESTSATRSRTLARNSSSCSSRSHSSAVGGGGAGPTTSRA